MLAVALVGCKVDATLTIDVEDDGSGVVSVALLLDAQAVQATEAGDRTLEDAVRLGDLERSGWEIGPWRRESDASASIRLSKAFTSPDQVAGIVDEISGADGPVRHVRASRDRGILATSYDVTGAVDLGAVGTGIMGDFDLIAALTSQAVDVAVIDQSLLQQVRDSLSVHVVVNLPDGTTTTLTGVAGERVALDAGTTVRDTRRIALILVAIGLVVLAVVVWFGGQASRRRARARAPIPRFDPHARRE